MNNETTVTVVPPGDDISCDACGMLACVCDIKAKHKPECRFLLAATCAVPIECEHGYDVCPKCDPCECGYEGGEF